jgi:hypothetical protein
MSDTPNRSSRGRSERRSALTGTRRSPRCGRRVAAERRCSKTASWCFGSTLDARKGADLRRDPRLALHSGTVDRVEAPRRTGRGGEDPRSLPTGHRGSRGRLLPRRHRRGRAHLPQQGARDARRRVAAPGYGLRGDRPRLTDRRAWVSGRAMSKARLVSRSGLVSHAWRVSPGADGLVVTVVVLAVGPNDMQHGRPRPVAFARTQLRTVNSTVPVH